MNKLFLGASLLCLLMTESASWSEIMNFKAHTVKYKMGSPKQVTCIGNAVISNEKNLMKANRIVIAGLDLDEAKMFGKVTVADYKSDMVLTSEYIEFFQKKDYIRALNKPILVMGSLVISSEVMERFLDKEISLIQGKSVISRSNVTVHCRSGIFDEKRKSVDLRGDPKIFVKHQEDEDAFDDFSCGRIVLYNTNNTVVLSRDVKGRIYLND